MRKQKLNYWYLTAIGLVFLTLVLTSFFVQSGDNFLFFGEETYTHLQSIEQNSSLSIYESITKALFSIFPQDISILIINIVLAVLFFILFVAIIKNYVKSDLELYLALLITTLSTQVVLIFSGLQNIAFLLVQILFLLVIYRISENISKNSFLKRSSLFFLVLCLIIIVFIQNHFIGLFASAFLFLYKLINRKKLKVSIKRLEFSVRDLKMRINFSGLLFFILLSLSIIKGFSDHLFSGFHVISLDSSFVFFGATIAYSLFIFILGLWGAISTNRVKSTVAKLFLLFILIISLFYYPFLVFGVIIFSFYSGIAFVNLIKKDWLIQSLQLLTIILFVCMFFFSSVIGFKALDFHEPTEMHVEALNEINNIQSDLNYTCATISNVLGKTHIEYFTKNPSYDSIYYEGELISSSKLFSMQQYPVVKEILNKSNTCFIHIDDNIKTKTQLNRPSEGLDLLIEYSGDFTVIYDKNGQRVYKYNLVN
ncbi:MAG: hypothetical protein U9R00_00150 [Patescibacteria group bacterium]|nr:hypothetical protein [Patescibacteria group bacterium]